MMPGSLKASAIAIVTRLTNSVLRLHRTWSSSTCTRLTLLCYDIVIDVNGSLSSGPSMLSVAAIDSVALNVKRCRLSLRLRAYLLVDIKEGVYV